MSIVTIVEAKLCVADMEDFEERVGSPLLEALEALKAKDAKTPDTTTLTGLIWIAKRHEEPDFTFEEARFVPISELVVDQEANPNRAARRAKPSGQKTKSAATKKPASKSKR